MPRIILNTNINPSYFLISLKSFPEYLQYTYTIFLGKVRPCLFKDETIKYASFSRCISLFTLFVSLTSHSLTF